MLMRELCEAREVPFMDREFEIVKAGTNGGDVGEVIQTDWFTDYNDSPYYLPKTERGQLKELKVGDTALIYSSTTAHEVTVKRVK